MRIIFLLSHAIFKSSPFVGPCRCQSINKICTRRRNKCCGHILSLHIIFFILFAFLQWRHSSKEEKKNGIKNHTIIFSSFWMGRTQSTDIPTTKRHFFTTYTQFFFLLLLVCLFTFEATSVVGVCNICAFKTRDTVVVQLILWGVLSHIIWKCATLKLFDYGTFSFIFYGTRESLSLPEFY